MLDDLRIPTEKLIKLYFDNKAAINITHNTLQHDRTKHVEVDRHFIKERLEVGLICMPDVSIEELLADVLTIRGSIDIFKPT